MTLIQIIKSIFIECPRLTKGHCTMITKITKEREVCCVEKEIHISTLGKFLFMDFCVCFFQKYYLIIFDTVTVEVVTYFFPL